MSQNKTVGQCYCTYEGALGPAFSPCINHVCERTYEMGYCFSMIGSGVLLKGCITSTRCWLTKAIDFRKKLINCCTGSMCNEAEDGSNLDVINLNDRAYLSDLKLWSNIEYQIKSGKDQSNYYAVVISLSIIIPIFLIAAASYVFYHMKKRRGKAVLSQLECGINLNTLQLSDITLSGSGAGLPEFIQRTITREIVLFECIGQGRFGAVYRGTWREQNVAVKLFSNTEEESWLYETKFYQSALLHHENVLGFIAADRKDSGNQDELWLVTEYHSNGSLYDYLQNHTLSIPAAFKIIYSLVNGLSYLHREVKGIVSKAPMAHRDLKTKNILLKRSNECCIADFGLSVQQTSAKNILNIPGSRHAGTTRYKAPELLDYSVAQLYIFEYQRADIYALALCLWEVCHRTIIHGKVLPYHLPYYDCVGEDPSNEEMKKVVCDEQKRPCYLPSWKTDKTVNYVATLISECWHSYPTARLTAPRIRKSLLNHCEKVTLSLH